MRSSGLTLDHDCFKEDEALVGEAWNLVFSLPILQSTSEGFRAAVVAQVVAHRTTDREILGLIPAGSFFLFSLSYQKCVLNQVPRGGATLLIFLHKMLSCPA